jgi:hypothetical protein
LAVFGSHREVFLALSSAGADVFANMRLLLNNDSSSSSSSEEEEEEEEEESPRTSSSSSSSSHEDDDDDDDELQLDDELPADWRPDSSSSSDEE